MYIRAIRKNLRRLMGFIPEAQGRGECGIILISRTGFLPLWGLPCTSEFFCWPLRSTMTNEMSIHTDLLPQIAGSFYGTFHKSLLALLTTPFVTFFRAPAHRGFAYTTL